MTDIPEQRLVIRVNSNLNWSRGKMAAHAVHAALKLYGIEYIHPVIVLGAKPPEILEQAVTVRDAGRTELEPGTLTAGASWSIPAADPGADLRGQLRATEALLEATQKQLSQFVRDFCALRDALPRERVAQILGIPHNPLEDDL